MINSQELQKLSTAMATAPLYAHDSDITFQKKELIREGEKEMRLMPAGDVRVPDKSCIATSPEPSKPIRNTKDSKRDRPRK